MNEHQRQEIEVTRKQIEEKIALGDALERLTKNRDFKKVFDNFIFDQLVEEGTVILTSSSEAASNGAKNVLVMAGQLRQTMHRIHKESEAAREALLDLEEHEESLLTPVEEA